MLVSSSDSTAPPLKRPAALASLTTPSARALGDGHFTFNFHGRFHHRCKLLAGICGLRADGLVQNYGNDGVRRNDQGLRFERPLNRALCGFRGGRRRIRIRVGTARLVRGLLASYEEHAE